MDFWFPHGRQVVTAREVATAFSMSEDQVAALEEQGILVAAPINDAPSGQRKRVHLRYERFSVVAWRLNELESRGQSLPIKETPAIAWWRHQLRERATHL